MKSDAIKDNPKTTTALRKIIHEKNKVIRYLEEKVKNGNILLVARTSQLQKANAEERRLTDFNCRIQLENIQLRCHRDTLLSSLADVQRRIQVMRIKFRPCAHGCGDGVNEDIDNSGLPLTDRAAEMT